MSHYIANFDRVGRNHNVEPFAFAASDADDAAFKVYRYVKPMLASRGVEVSVDLEAMSGQILCGFNNGGTFTLSAADAGGEG